MPEAPWIRRWGGKSAKGDMEGGGIKFTDNMLMHEDDEDMEDEEGKIAIEDRDEGGSPTIPKQDDHKSPGVMVAKKKARQHSQDVGKQALKATQQPQGVFHDESPYL